MAYMDDGRLTVKQYAILRYLRYLRLIRVSDYTVRRSEA
jgi:hypothetical protein